MPRNTGAGVPKPDPEPACPICRDAGYVRFNVPLSDPNFGRLVACECLVRERERQRHADLVRIGNLGAFEDKLFENFDPGVAPDVEEARAAATAYAKDPTGSGKPWIFFHGQCGTGKTHLAAAIANHYIGHQGGRALFTIVPDLLDHLRSTFNPAESSGLTYDQLFQDVREVPLLILDDLGTENATPWAKEKLFQIFNHRYNEGLATVVTSNHDFDQIDARIVSRLGDSQMCRYVLIDAPDYRRRDNARFGPAPRRAASRAGGGRARS